MPLIKYIGGTVPFTFRNPQIPGEEPTWKKRGDVVECSSLAARILTVGSGDDFKLVKGEIEAPPAPPPVDKNDRKSTVSIMNDDGPDTEGHEDALFADEREEKRKPGRPRKE